MTVSRPVTLPIAGDFEPSVNHPVGLHVTQCSSTPSGSYDSDKLLVLDFNRHQTGLNQLCLFVSF